MFKRLLLLFASVPVILMYATSGAPGVWPLWPLLTLILLAVGYKFCVMTFLHHSDRSEDAIVRAYYDDVLSARSRAERDVVDRSYDLYMQRGLV